mgnify:FL=1
MSSEGAVHENGVDQGGVRSSQQDIMEVRDAPGCLGEQADPVRPCSDSSQSACFTYLLFHGLYAELVRLSDSLLGSADSFFQGLLADKAALAAELAERRGPRAVTAEQAEAKKLRLQAVQADIEAKKAELKRWQEVSLRLRGMSGRAHYCSRFQSLRGKH